MLPTCIRCSQLIRETQACVPVFRGDSVDSHHGPSWRHYLSCCSECGALGKEYNKAPEPHQHRTRCSQYVRPPLCGALIEGVLDPALSRIVPCTRIAGHRERTHRAKARFAGPTDLTVTWPVDR
jgi:hypothetical protein